jgi:hypothetical protein
MTYPTYPSILLRRFFRRGTTLQQHCLKNVTSRMFRGNRVHVSITVRYSLLPADRPRSGRVSARAMDAALG